MNGLREGFFEGLREGLGPSSVKGRAPRGAPAKLGLWRRARVGEGAGPCTLFIEGDAGSAVVAPGALRHSSVLFSALPARTWRGRW